MCTVTTKKGIEFRMGLEFGVEFADIIEGFQSQVKVPETTQTATSPFTPHNRR